jgi:predicted enzyme related to lactoylglutathione lyase
MFHHVLAQCTVTDVDRAEDWYARLLGRGPDTRPMPGLVEWYVGDSAGLQVWSEPGRAGKSSVVLGVTDLDGAASRARDEGLAHDGPQAGGDGRIVLLVDPDGNRVVLAGA